MLVSVAKDNLFIDIEKDVISNLQSRYYGNFKFVDYVQEENTENSRVMNIEGDEGNFKLIRYYDSYGNVRYCDNYLGYVYYDDIVKLVDNCLKEVRKGCNFDISLEESSFPDETTKFQTLQDLLANEKTFLQIRIVSKEAWKDDDVTMLAKSLSSVGIKANVIVLEEYDDINFNDFNNIILSVNSMGRVIYFSVDERGELLYMNRE